MVRLPSETRLSAGVWVAPFRDGAVAYDVVMERTHVVHAPASDLLLRLAAHRTEDGFVVASGGFDVTDVATGVETASVVTELRNLGLLDRTAPLDEQVIAAHHPSVAPGLAGRLRATTGSTHAVLDHGVAFRSSDPALLEEIDSFLGLGAPGLVPTTTIDVESCGDGAVDLIGSEPWRFPDRRALFAQLPWILNQYATRSAAMIVLHAGGVRTPAGDTVLVVGESNAGKSTLVASLLQAGCDYLGDEAIGVQAGSLQAIGYPKPLTLDDSSCRYLGLGSPPSGHIAAEAFDPGVERVTDSTSPITAIIALRRHEPPVVEATRLGADDALVTLLANAMNVGRAGESGLRTVAELAERVPVIEMAYPDAVVFVSELLSERGPAIGVLEAALALPVPPAESRCYAGLIPSPLGAYRPARIQPTEFATVSVSGGSATVVRSAKGAVQVLDLASSSLWARVDGETTVAELVQAGADTTNCLSVRWTETTAAIDDLQSRSLISEEALEPISTSAGFSSECVSQPRSVLRGAHRDSWLTGALQVRVGTVLAATDHPAVRRLLRRVVEAGHGELTEPGGRVEHTSLIALRELPVAEAGAELQFDGDLQWVPPGDEARTFAAALLGVLADGVMDHAPALRPSWVVTNSGRAALLIGGEPNRLDRGTPWRRIAVPRLERGSVLHLIEETGALSSILAGVLDPDPRLWQCHDVTVGIVADDELEALRLLGESVSPSSSTASADALRRSLPAASAQLVLGEDGGHLCARLEATVGVGQHASVKGSDPGARTQSHVGLAPHRDGTSRSMWEAVGSVRNGPESAKIDLRGLSMRRPVLFVDVADSEATAAGERSVRQLLETLFHEAGLGTESGLAADIASHARRLLVSTDTSSDGTRRRKVYLSGASPEQWKQIRDRWPPDLTAGEEAPTWLAWKMTSRNGVASLARAVQVSRLAGAETVGEGIAPVLEGMPRQWRRVVDMMLEAADVDFDGRPGRDQDLTIQEDGRRSIDLAVCPPDRRRTAVGLEGPIRSLAVLAGLDDRGVAQLLRWTRAARLSNIIFGCDSEGSPFVNLYRFDRSAQILTGSPQAETMRERSA